LEADNLSCFSGHGKRLLPYGANTLPLAALRRTSRYSAREITIQSRLARRRIGVPQKRHLLTKRSSFPARSICFSERSCLPPTQRTRPANQLNTYATSSVFQEPRLPDPAAGVKIRYPGSSQKSAGKAKGPGFPGPSHVE
jgi:hypothetical protein